MKALPKLMKNSYLTIQIVSEEMPDFTISLHGATEWPFKARLDPDQVLRFFDVEGNLIHETFGTWIAGGKIIPNFGLAFIGVTESTVDFKTKSQSISAKMRAIDLDAHENLHTDNWDSYEG